MDSVAARAAPAFDITPTMRKVMRRIIPFIFVCYVVSYLDRINVGFAGLQMNRDLGLTPSQFGWGAGLFFLGYFLCEIPSNLMMQRVGARLWIARIMITWGLLSTLTCLVTGPVSFSAMRLLLGMAEAGFTPGVYLYFTYWFPGVWRGRATAAFLVGIPVANMIGSPVSGALLTMDGFAGLAGWQWLLIIEGLPAVLLGIACLFVLSDRPGEAKWLDADERRELDARLTAEQATLSARHGNTLRDAFANPKVFVLALVNFCGICGSLGVGLWLPQIVRGFGVSYVAVGFISAAPYALGAVCMLLWARLANRARHRLWFVCGALATAGVALSVSASFASPLPAMLALTVTVVGILSFQATYWAIPSGFLTGRAAAAGLALIVSVGNLGGFVGPYMIGYLRETTKSFSAPLYVLSAILLVGTAVMFALGDPARDTASAKEIA
ncbi:putative permeases of the major facilitator superfamily [Bradyrhizobium sp. ORS 285]|uniref:MFS transporter n=1 Tax=Bradyrhizobium sp. ORS 285 TaxID=115808 RepID=UPI0002407EF7|nr:MFS transporter [Bradyrhizobium sp. ORS 285]CCD88555.1 putative permeases of the major facilitator superfamily [Bradyrhizobium sp. ORS 285]SMX58488.1 putative permeases of the major facilitator superfamily [Bradyrhizobium sp. ORS 285]